MIRGIWFWCCHLSLMEGAVDFTKWHEHHHWFGKYYKAAEIAPLMQFEKQGKPPGGFQKKN